MKEVTVGKPLLKMMPNISTHTLEGDCELGECGKASPQIFTCQHRRIHLRVSMGCPMGYKAATAAASVQHLSRCISKLKKLRPVEEALFVYHGYSWNITKL